MKISIIVAVSENNVIGKDNDLIWHLPADMRFFKETTTGHCVLTGRKNYESIPEKYRPLANRTNIVLSRSKKGLIDGAHFIDGIDTGIQLAQELGEDELFIIGGGEIYAQTIDRCERIYLTRVHSDFEGDTYFPELGEEWQLKQSERRLSDERNPYDMSFNVYEKIMP